MKIVVTYGKKCDIVGWAHEEEILHVVTIYLYYLTLLQGFILHYYKIKNV